MGWYDNVGVQQPRSVGYQDVANTRIVADDLLKRGLGDFQNISNDYRISKGRDVANRAIEDLMAKKPDKTTDPTQHIGEVSRLLAFASPEMRDTVKPYMTALDTNYGRELQNQQFSKNMDMNQKQLAEQARHSMAMERNAAAQLGLSSQQFNMMKAQRASEMEQKGFVPDRTSTSGYKFVGASSIDDKTKPIIDPVTKKETGKYEQIYQAPAYVTNLNIMKNKMKNEQLKDLSSELMKIDAGKIKQSNFTNDFSFIPNRGINKSESSMLLGTIGTMAQKGAITPVQASQMVAQLQAGGAGGVVSLLSQVIDADNPVYGKKYEPNLFGDTIVPIAK